MYAQQKLKEYYTKKSFNMLILKTRKLKLYICKRNFDKNK